MSTTRKDSSRTATEPGSVADVAKNGTDRFSGLDNKQFYDASGNFNQEAAKRVYLDFLQQSGYLVNDTITKRLFVSDFGLGRFTEAGAPFGIKPCSLGARDTLRTEVCYPLYGHELDKDTTPIEAGVGFFVALDKGDFIGRSVLAEQKANGVLKKCIAFKMTDKSAPPRPHYPIWANGAKVGDVVSGTQSPSLGIGVGMGYVPPEFAKKDTAMEIEIRGKRAAAVVVAKPIYRKG